MKKEKET